MNRNFKTRRRMVKIRRIFRFWPWILSVAIHCLILAVLSTVVFISFTATKDTNAIVPEAKLGKINRKLPLFQKIDNNLEVQPEKEFENKLRKDLDPGRLANKKKGGKLSVVGMRTSKSIAIPGCDLSAMQSSAPVTRFFSSAGNAYNIVYMVDRSASMIDTIDPLKKELKRSIEQLQPMQKFQVIFFSSGKPVEGPAKKLIWATDRNKKMYSQFIDSIHAEGQTDPQWALQRALGMKPDLIYLLTDGVFSEKIAKKMIKWARDYHVKINTIAYMREIGSGILTQIAERTGGVYRFVTESELQ